jgi:adenylylsulfate kinase
MYKKAETGEIKYYTGVSAPYEEPENPDIVLDTHLFSIEECIEKVFNYIQDMILIKRESTPKASI